MKTYKNISVRATRTNVVRNNETKTIIQQIGVEVIDINTGRGWKIWLNAKYYEKGRLLEELKGKVESCCVDQIAGMEEGMTIESIADKMRAGVQQCIDDNDIYSYTTIGRGGKLVEHYYYTPKNTFKCEEDKSLKERYPEEVEYILTMADSIIEQNASDGKEITFWELVNELVYKLHEATDEPYSDEVYEKKAKRLGLNDLPTLWYPNKKEIEEILDEDNDTMGYLDRHHNNTMVAEPTLFEQENQVDDATNLDQPKANTETNKNNNTMNSNREKMMGGVVTTKKGLTINVWGLKNNNYQVKVSKGNRKASFEVPMPKCIPEVDPGFFRPAIAKYIEKHMEDLQMPELLSPNVKKAHKDKWNQNKDEWVAYGQRISDNYTIEYPNEAAKEKEQTPVVIEEPQAVVEEQEQIEDAPMVDEQEQVVDVAEGKTNDVDEEDDMKFFIATIESQVGQNIRTTIKYNPIAVKTMTKEIYRAYSSSIWSTNNTQYLLTLLFAYCGLESLGLTCTNKLIDDICNAWEVEGLPTKKNIVRRISNLFDGGGVANIDEYTIQELRDIAAGADETFEISGVNIINLYTVISLAQVNEKWESQVRKLLHGNTQDKEEAPVIEEPNAPEETPMVVDEPQAKENDEPQAEIKDEDRFVTWYVNVKGDHTAGESYYDATVTSINENYVGKNYKHTTTVYLGCVGKCFAKDPNGNKKVKGIIERICKEFTFMLQPRKTNPRFTKESEAMFRQKVREQFNIEFNYKDYKKTA